MLRPGRLLIIVFGAASLIAVLAGCWAASNAGVPVATWARMIAAWVIGLGMAISLARLPRWGDRRAFAFAAGVIVLLLLSFADAGLEGVHRWVVIGPVRLNVAALVLPIAIVVMAGQSWAAWAGLAIMVLLVAQPDASQATSFAVAAAVLTGARARNGFAGAALAAIILLGALSWLRPDPLASVAEVEGIVGLAWHQHPALAILAVTALVLATITPVVIGYAGQRDPAARAITAYMMFTAALPIIGAFPVPLVGMSMSPILGFWLGIGALAESRNSSAPNGQRRDQ